MDVQVKFPKIKKAYSYNCINKANTGDRVIILEGQLSGRDGIVVSIRRSDYKGKLFKCWRPEFKVEDLIELNLTANNIDEIEVK